MDDWRLRTESVCVREIRGSGTHTIRWRYSKNGSGSAGEDCVWVDYVRWSGTMPDAGPWGQIEYVYDPSGRRIEKKVDGDTELKFLYDGDHIIAEYDANDTLLRKYVHGPCIDEPICLIESSGDYAGTQYYHYDALGSVVAMTDASGDAVQLYEYSIYGQVAASDPNHPNRFMFTGREFDKDTGLYYYRARYYHPEIGRFLQTDPTGYGDGINWYRYCANNPTNFIDPSGLVAIAFYDGGDIGDGDGDGNSDWKIANGDDLKEEADDFNIYEAGLTVELAFDLRTAETLGMSHTEYLIWVLETWSDMGGLSPITETYIFDHGSESGLQIGDEGLEFSGIGADGTLTWGEDFIDFCQGLKDNTNPDTVIHFRGCN
ncbi:MAG: RHS repeat-associated core domain-containing protein, partial [Phycisphaerales bacterium]